MDGSFRISLSRHTTREELQLFTNVIKDEIIARFK
jgi:cysteine sulfinate desulfinase/cysteine desulfurase-like protein